MSDLVVDADIMRASGTSEHPESKNARLILEQIRVSGHRLVQTPALKKEHDKHKSRFAQTWRVSMVSKKQWLLVKPPENPVLRQHLVQAQNPDSKRDETAVLKDAHLLEAAAGSDFRIISRDSTAKKLFQNGCPLPEPYGRIQWADVSLYPDETLLWIRQNCPEQKDWRICP
jgi:hypothetical protein